MTKKYVHNRGLADRDRCECPGCTGAKAARTGSPSKKRNAWFQK